MIEEWSERFRRLGMPNVAVVSELVCGANDEAEASVPKYES